MGINSIALSLGSLCPGRTPQFDLLRRGGTTLAENDNIVMPRTPTSFTPPSPPRTTNRRPPVMRLSASPAHVSSACVLSPRRQPVRQTAASKPAGRGLVANDTGVHVAPVDAVVADVSVISGPDLVRAGSGIIANTTVDLPTPLSSPPPPSPSPSQPPSPPSPSPQPPPPTSERYEVIVAQLSTGLTRP